MGDYSRIQISTDGAMSETLVPMHEADAQIEALRAEVERLRECKELLDFIEQNHAEVTFAGVEAERVPNGSTVKEFWEVDCGALYNPDALLRRELIWEEIGLRNVLRLARKELKTRCNPGAANSAPEKHE